MTTSPYAQGWFADPTGRHRVRWSDGTDWTDWVADGTSATREADGAAARTRRDDHPVRFVLTAVGLGIAALIGAVLLVAALVDVASTGDLDALRAEVRGVEVPETLEPIRSADLDAHAQIGLSEAFVERTYRPAPGVPVEQAVADLAAALERQGYRLRATDYTFRGQEYRGWSGACHATDYCTIDLDYLGNRITLRFEA